jgi:hypothetical protein
MGIFLSIGLMKALSAREREDSSFVRVAYWGRSYRHGLLTKLQKDLIREAAHAFTLNFALFSTVDHRAPNWNTTTHWLQQTKPPLLRVVRGIANFNFLMDDERIPWQAL